MTGPLDGGRLTGFVATTDAERAREFYVGVLGLVLQEDSPFAIVLDSGGIQVRVQKVHAVEPAPYTILGWAVADIEAVARALADAGVAPLRIGMPDQDQRGIWSAPGGARVLWFHDPDGQTLSITQHPDPAP